MENGLIMKEDVLKQFDLWAESEEYNYPNALYYLRKRVMNLKVHKTETITYFDDKEKVWTKGNIVKGESDDQDF